MKNIIKKFKQKKRWTKATNLFFGLFGGAFIGAFLGLLITVGVMYVQAAWNSTVSSGDTLTAAGWNEHVAKLINLNNRTGTLEGKTNLIVVGSGPKAGCANPASATPPCPGTHPNSVATWTYSEFGGASGYCVRWRMCSK